MMHFHPEKCQVLSITKKRKPLDTTYYLHGHPLEKVESAKYLGVNITSDLKWTRHINTICQKANNTLGFLRRNLKISHPKLKELAYKSLVRPIIEYGCATWDPYQQNHIDQLEKVQRRAARFVKNNYERTASVTSMLQDLKWEPLKERRKKARLCTMYKMIHKDIRVQTNDKLVPPIRTSRRTNHSMSYQIPSCNTAVRNQSFFPRTIRDWNKLPERTAMAVSMESFKNFLNIKNLKLSP